MKLVSLLALLILSVSCGKDGGGGSSSVTQENICDLDGRAVACESIQGADGQGVDLLESMVDVPVKIANSEIMFMSDKSASSQGRRISCKVAVKNGEKYGYALNGNSLIVTTSTGTYQMNRLTDGDSIVGTWAWKGYEAQGTHLIRTMSFLSDSRVILKTSCEL